MKFIQDLNIIVPHTNLHFCIGKLFQSFKLSFFKSSRQRWWSTWQRACEKLREATILKKTGFYEKLSQNGDPPVLYLRNPYLDFFRPFLRVNFFSFILFHLNGFVQSNDPQCRRDSSDTRGISARTYILACRSQQPASGLRIPIRMLLWPGKPAQRRLCNGITQSYHHLHLHKHAPTFKPSKY